MPLENFKTQVLLLHSEQSTLDKLSKGFSDRYTVHCATSGSEALSTLGQVPIHVIVTAQDLPGMSGLDALREAKKRSPETIGILLTGDNDNDVEALVGAKEVFQVVRGSVTPESVRKLIENATQQARLLALAESANDTAANPDEPAGEHIVMETSENGSSIISDGTGRMRALDPATVSASAAVGARAVELLVLTKDEDFHRTVRDSARGLHNVVFATTIAQADEAIRKHKIGVAVIDAAMFGSKVEKLTVHLRAAAPRLVSIVAGRRDDGEMLMDLINRGKVYRFLLKPVSPGRARLAIDASVKHHLEAPDSAFKAIDADTLGKASAAIARIADDTPAVAPKPAPSRDAVKTPPPKPVQNKPAPRPQPVTAKREPEPANPLPDLAIRPSRSEEKVDKAPPSIAATPTADAAAIPEELTPPGWLYAREAKMLGLGAAVVAVVLAVVGFMFFGGDDKPAPTPRPAEPPAVVESVVEEPALPVEEPAPAEPAVDLDAVLADARAAAADGRIYGPPGDNAIELYLSAAAQLPDEAVVTLELDNAINQALGMAEAALLERRANDAAAILQRVAFADPDHARLPFLTAQLGELRLRLVLDEAREALRAQRFDEADVAVARARELAPADASAIDAVAEEIAAARLEQEVSGILASATARLDAGALVEPANDSAAYYYRQALAVDADNTAALQGLTVVAGKLVLMARSAIDQRNFADAEALMADARQLDPESVELANAATALAAERELVEQERLEAERRAAEERAAAERAAAEKAAAEKAAAEKAAAEKAAAEKAAAEKAAAEKAAAEKAAAEKAAAEKAAAEKAAAEKAAAEKAAAEKAAAEKAAAERAAAARQAEVQRLTVESAVPQTPKPAAPAPKTQSAPRQEPAAQATAPAPEPEQTRREEPAPAVTEQRSEPTRSASAVNSPPPAPAVEPEVVRVVPASSLTRTRYVAPKYPRAAERRGLTGWVDVVFTVDTDGSVRDVEVKGAEPADTFVESAMNAVQLWEFEPVMRDGVAIEQPAAVRLMFAIE